MSNDTLKVMSSNYWEKRGMAAFHPSLENLDALLQVTSSLAQPKHELEKLALENNVASLDEIIQKKSK